MIGISRRRFCQGAAAGTGLLADEKIAKTDGFIGEVGESGDLCRQTREEADPWYDSLTADIFG